MILPGKAARKAANVGSRVAFEDYSWDAWKGPGTFSAVVLFVSDDPSKSGKEMVTITFGLEAPDGQLGGRIQHWVLLSFMNRVDEMLMVLAPEVADEEQEVEWDPNAMRGRRCAVEIELDEKYQRNDGKPSHKVVRLHTLESTERDLGPGWELKP